MTTRQPLSPPPALTLDPQKVTPGMRESLQSLRDCLLCPLCNQLLVEPSTLTCAHSFCLACIEHYTCDAWNCPVPGCGMPVSVRGGREGRASYLAINPQLRTIVSSFGVISQTLNNAPNEWWKTPMPESMEEEEQVDLQAHDEEVDLQAADKQEHVPVASLDATQSSPQTKENEATDSRQCSSPKNKTETTPLSQKGNIATLEGQLSLRSEGEDSQRTVKFSMPDPPSSSSDSPNNWLDPIVEEQQDAVETDRPARRSCLLPSQSPGFSPIAANSSPTDDSPNPKATDQFEKAVSPVNLSVVPKESSTAEVKETPKRTRNNRKPRLFVASSLSSTDQTIVQECLQRDQLTLLLDSVDDHVDVEDEMAVAEFMSRLQDAPRGGTYAVCGNAELETGDGFLVGRSFGYLLSVACGLPLVYMDYLRQAKNTNKKGFLFAPRKIGKNQVIGDVHATKWMAPQRALESTAEGDGVGTSLLKGYTILLYGDFDKVPSQKSRLGAGRKRARNGRTASAPDTSNLYSRGRMQCLLQLCGAHVYDLQKLLDEHSSKRSSSASGSDLLSSGSGKVAILLRPDPLAHDWRSAQKVLADYQFLQTLDPVPAIVRGNWLLDSIGDFEVKEFAEYMQMAVKRSAK